MTFIGTLCALSSGSDELTVSAAETTYIQLVNFWPDMDLDEYINLKSRVETRMKISVMTSTGDDDLINAEEKGDLEYRRQQLKRLQEEVVDMEEMGKGISITDLGLNEFRMELLEYSKTHPELENSPGWHQRSRGSNTGCAAGGGVRAKNVHNECPRRPAEPPAPVLLWVYLGSGGRRHGSRPPFPKRHAGRDAGQLCRGKDKPIEALYQAFNRETKRRAGYGRVFRSAGGCGAVHSGREGGQRPRQPVLPPAARARLLSQVSGLDDFELICFLVVREEPSC